MTELYLKVLNLQAKIKSDRSICKQYLGSILVGFVARVWPGRHPSLCMAQCYTRAFAVPPLFQSSQIER